MSRTSRTAVGIIPARFESSRLPGKPLELIGDKPIIRRIYEAAAAALDHVYVATDSLKIQEATQAFGGKCVLTATAHPNGSSRCHEAMRILQGQGVQFDSVINIQGDEAQLVPGVLRDLIRAFDQNTEFITLAKRLSEFPEKIKQRSSAFVVTDKNGYALYFSRYPIPYGFDTVAGVNDLLEHIGIYGYSVAALTEFVGLADTPLQTAESLEQLKWLEHGKKIKVVSAEFNGISIDTPQDLEAARRAYATTSVRKT